jgi:hypothetical protein
MILSTDTFQKTSHATTESQKKKKKKKKKPRHFPLLRAICFSSYVINYMETENRRVLLVTGKKSEE